MILTAVVVTLAVGCGDGDSRDASPAEGQNPTSTTAAPDPLGAGEGSGSRFESFADLAGIIPGCAESLEPEGRQPIAVSAKGAYAEDVDYVEAERGRCQPGGGAEFTLYVADQPAIDMIAKREERLACSLGFDGLVAGLEPATLVRGENWLATSGEDFDWEAIEQISEGTNGRVIVMCQLGPKGIPAEARRPK